MDLKTRYKVKGIGSEQIIESVVAIHSNAEGKITEVKDQWNGKIPEGAFTKVSLFQLLSPISWLNFFSRGGFGNLCYWMTVGDWRDLLTKVIVLNL